MTVRELGAAMLRRWYVVLVVMLLAGTAGFILHRDEGVYTSQTVVSFLLPDKTSLSLNSGLDDASVIAFAGAIAREVNGGTTPVTYSTNEAPIFGAGQRQRVLITLPDAGSQFVTAYQRAEIVVQIVGPTQSWVEQKQSHSLDQILRASQAQQSTVHPASERIRVAPVELTKRIFHVVPSRSAQIGAITALLAAGAVVAGWAAVVLDGVVRRRKPEAGTPAGVRFTEERPNT